MTVPFLEEANRFYLTDGETDYAEITWSSANESLLIVDHTFVDDSHRGEGLAKQLVERVVQKARDENKKILPLCPYAKGRFERTPEYADVWHK